jgi:ubiquinone/menaquinone biosynthesis C-methylase UbiE
MVDSKTYWEGVYERNSPMSSSWYQHEASRSLDLLVSLGVGPTSNIIDVGGGDSTLVDGVVARRMGRVTVLDLSRTALQRARMRLGSNADLVTWMEGDVLQANLPSHFYDVWHDRAVFHFLTDREDRLRYVAAATSALKPGGAVVIATFALEGPEHCSGLQVERYDSEMLAREFGDAFSLVSAVHDVHRTPSGAEQQFTYAVLRLP